MRVCCDWTWRRRAPHVIMSGGRDTWYNIVCVIRVSAILHPGILDPWGGQVRGHCFTKVSAVPDPGARYARLYSASLVAWPASSPLRLGMTDHVCSTPMPPACKEWTRPSRGGGGALNEPLLIWCLCFQNCSTGFIISNWIVHGQFDIRLHRWKMVNG